MPRFLRTCIRASFNRHMSWAARNDVFTKGPYVANWNPSPRAVSTSSIPGLLINNIRYPNNPALISRRTGSFNGVNTTPTGSKDPMPNEYPICRGATPLGPNIVSSESLVRYRGSTKS